MHKAKFDVVTVPNLSEHLSSAETTEQLSARFASAAAMKSMNNLLLLGDGETWSRQTVDFAGLPEMARTFLQVAAGAADIPVTRLLGQSSSGLSATGESDVRNDARHDRGAAGAGPAAAAGASRPADLPVGGD
ncbi:anti-CBASS protein Acb1 family protein [Lichenibacterium minor]|uniref:anti-CBASS protein Acb1 family protein n=1 Tax=Lichenibacterium minor TaxID=2316528 RepID=UPI0024798531|nr:anti-CBASS Acb1 family protein [Lichenibacterium minor]